MKKMNEHLNEVNETYFEHLKTASTYGFKLLFMSISCFVHAIFPSLCTNSVHKRLNELRNDIVKRKK